MRIAMLNITFGGMSSGYRKYLRNIIPRMVAHPDVDAILCASSESLNVQDWFEPLPNIEFVNCRPICFMRSSLDYKLKQHLEKFSPDIIFVPLAHYFRLNEIPVVNMVQNMEPFVSGIDGNPISEQFRNWVRRIDGKRTLEKSDRIIAISRYVRDFLIQHCNIPDDKIGLVYHGVETLNKDDFKRPFIVPESWKGKFLFTAGSIRSARGVEDLIYALKYIFDNSLDISGIVIAGETTPEMNKYKKRLKDLINSFNFSSKVLWPGNLNEKEMTWCYQGCCAFITTSRVEACPNIALEAMSHGCISVSTDNPPMPEIFGDAAVYYPPQNGKALAEALRSVLAWTSYQRNEASERARQRAAKFSWDVCAEKTVQELKKAIEDKTLR